MIEETKRPKKPLKHDNTNCIINKCEVCGKPTSSHKEKDKNRTRYYCHPCWEKREHELEAEKRDKETT